MSTRDIQPDQLDATASALAAMAAGDLGVEQRSAERNNAAMARFLSGGDLQSERVSRPFEQVGAVNRCIRIIGDALSSMPLMISTADDQILQAGEILDFLNEPYPGLSGEELIEWTAALALLTGACYWIFEASAGTIPIRMRPVGYPTCRPKYDADGELAGYIYRKPGDRSHRERHLDPEEVIPFTLPNFQRENLHEGISQLKPAWRSIEQVFGADTANLESLHNGVDPGIVFHFPDRPSDDQLRDHRDMIDDRHRGTYRRNRPMYSWGNGKIETFTKSFTDMEFTKLKSMSIVDVCVSLGVPPLVAGYSGEQGMGHGKELEEAHSVFWFVTALPLATWIARKITVNVLPRFARRSRSFNQAKAFPSHQRRCPTYRVARRSADRLSVRVISDGRAVRRPPQYFAWFDSSGVDAVRDAALKRLKEMAILHEKLVRDPGRCDRSR